VLTEVAFLAPEHMTCGKVRS